MGNIKGPGGGFPKQRDLVFVFGAGASYADGAPLQKEILPIIMAGKIPDIEESETGQIVREFIDDNFAWDEKKGAYPTLETVFGFLDHFISQEEHLSSKYSNTMIRAIKEGLIKLIHFVISEKTNREAKIYHSFWETLLESGTDFSILTLNYDTLLEEAFKSIYPGKGCIDYGVYLMNYELHREMDWVSAGGPAYSQERKGPFPVKIMKAHGSLNWKYCNCCNQVLLTPWDTKINLYNNFFKPDGEAVNGLNRNHCPIDGSDFETLIIPPSHIKRISHPVISQVLNQALREIRLCKKVIFVGYSFPDADVHFKALFKKSLLDKKEIVVVNRSTYDELLLNYKSLSRNVQFIKSSFADFITGGTMTAELNT